MPEEVPDRPLEHLLDRLRFILSEPIDFNRSDQVAILTHVRLLTAAATYFNVMALTDFGGRSGPERERGLAEQVIAAAFQTFDGVDPHPGPFDKAAMIARGIIQGHPFNDANKRTGCLTATYYLELVGVPLPDDFDFKEMEELAVRISAGDLRNVSEIAVKLEHLWNADRSS